MSDLRRQKYAIIIGCEFFDCRIRGCVSEKPAPKIVQSFTAEPGIGISTLLEPILRHNMFCVHREARAAHSQAGDRRGACVTLALI